MKSKLLSKIRDYSVLASAAVAASSADGQIVYTDVNPDQVFNNNGSYNLDLNNDLTTDFILSVFTSGSNRFVTIDPQSGNQALGSGADSNSWNYPFAISANSGITRSQVAWFKNATSKSPLLSYYYYSSSSYSSFGNWANQTDKYLGLRVVLGTDTVYGWARCDVNGNASSFTIKDFAYQACVGLPILAGDSTTDSAAVAMNVKGNDFRDNGDGTDLEITFDKPASEVGITEYRIMIVKRAFSSTFNVDSAKAVPAGNYISHIPNGNNYVDTMMATTRDVDGNVLVANLPYTIFVLSLPDGVNKSGPNLSAGFDTIINDLSASVAELEALKFKAYAYDQKLVLDVDPSLIGQNVQVMDNTGRMVREAQIAATRETIGLGNLSTGVYLVRVGEETRKVLVE